MAALRRRRRASAPTGGSGTLTWPGAIDLDSEMLHSHVRGEPLPRDERGSATEAPDRLQRPRALVRRGAPRAALDGLRFEWDEEKAAANLRKHGVSFLEASTAFGDPRAIEVPDPTHSDGEQRWLLVGRSSFDRLVVVVHTERGENVRIISARRAAWRERWTYEQA